MIRYGFPDPLTRFRPASPHWVMKTLEHLFRTEVDAFLERTGLGLAALGREAVGDPNLMRVLLASGGGACSWTGASRA